MVLLEDGHTYTAPRCSAATPQAELCSYEGAVVLLEDQDTLPLDAVWVPHKLYCAA